MRNQKMALINKTFVRNQKVNLYEKLKSKP